MIDHIGISPIAHKSLDLSLSLNFAMFKKKLKHFYIFIIILNSKNLSFMPKPLEEK